MLTAELVRDELSLMEKIAELKEKGLGYRSIGKLLNLHYKKVERLYKKYLKLQQVTQDPKTPVTSLSIYFSLKTRRHVELPEDDTPDNILYNMLFSSNIQVLYKKLRLGRTQRLILSIMLEEPGMYWTPSMIKRKLGILKYTYTRRAIHAALRRLFKRGIVEYVKAYVLVEGEVLKGAYRLRTISTPKRILVHNLRTRRFQVVSDKPMDLMLALLKAKLIYGETFPVVQAEIHYDIPVSKELLEYLHDLGWRMTVISPKPKERRIRFEHRLWKTKLTTDPESYSSWIKLYQILTEHIYQIVLHEMLRLS